MQTTVDGDDVILTWQSPASDGGDAITQYVVVYREQSKQKFKKCGKTKPDVTSFAMTSSLKEGTLYITDKERNARVPKDETEEDGE